MMIKPMIAEGVLVRGERPYKGRINPGDVFAWEPDLPHARELVVVTRISTPDNDKVIVHARGSAVISGGHEQRIWTRSIDGDDEFWNDESRFREAVVPTLFKPYPITRGRLT